MSDVLKLRVITWGLSFFSRFSSFSRLFISFRDSLAFLFCLSFFLLFFGEQSCFLALSMFIFTLLGAARYLFPVEDNLIYDIDM